MFDLETRIKQGAKIFDVRTMEEFNEEHYPNAVNIPVDQIRERMSEFGPKSTPIVVYCASGARSAFAAKLLKGAGYSDVVNAGGLCDMPEW